MIFLSELTGSFAMPAAENPTVAIVEAAYRHHAMEWRYINCEIAPEMLGDAVRGARAMGWRGFNCSLPHKVAVIEHLDHLGESAEIIGAVNCVVATDGVLTGQNTDGKGFVESLRGFADLRGANVVVLGAGGAARAIAVESALAGAAHISIVNRTPARGEELATLVSDRTTASAEFLPLVEGFRIPEAADILVNATSIGLFPNVNETPCVDMSSLSPKTLVADVIPNPPQTRFLGLAQENGCQTVNGHGMLVNQAVKGIEYWSGVRVDGAVMLSVLSDIFG